MSESAFGILADILDGLLRLPVQYSLDHPGEPCYIRDAITEEDQSIPASTWFSFDVGTVQSITAELWNEAQAWESIAKGRSRFVFNASLRNGSRKDSLVQIVW